MRRLAFGIVLSEEEKAVLQDWLRRGKTEQRLADRARIVLLAQEGKSNKEIARELGMRVARVSKWCGRCRKQGIAGLRDAARSGKPARYDGTTEKRVLCLLDEPPPKGYSQWNGNRLAEALPDINKAQIWRILRKHNICLERRRSWCISTDPDFGPKAAEVMGFYLNPPENALVLSVDEKPSIQALERAQGYLRLPDGKAVNGFSHCYKRHGTTTLFAALEVATGLVQTGHYKRRRRREFLDFMNEVVAGREGREIHVILDNLNTHKPKDDRWLKRHKNVHFHFIPTYSSWLNQVECWFSILSRQALQGTSFTSPGQVRQAIDNFVTAYNEKAAPFEWKKAAVFPSAPKKKYPDLCN